MGQIKVEIIDPAGKKVKTKLPDYAPVSRLMRELIVNMNLPITDGNGRSINYHLVHEESGKGLKDEESLRNADINQGDILRIVESGDTKNVSKQNPEVNTKSVVNNPIPPKVYELQRTNLNIGEAFKRYYVIIYFVFLCIIAIYLTGMFADMKDNGYINKTSLETLPSGIKETWYILLTFSFGAFYGANIIAILDKKKRVQGLLILSASLIVVVIYNYVIFLRPIVFFFGLIASAFVSCALKKETGKRIKYPVATQIATYPAIIFISMAFINYALGVPQIDQSNVYTIIMYLLLTLAFGIVFFKFVRYEMSNIKVFVVGPGKSGKTVFMCGCYEKAVELDKLVLAELESKDLSDAINKLQRGEWPLETTSEIVYRFNYENGFLFVKEVIMDAYDYPGQKLEIYIDGIIKYLKDKNKDPKISPKTDEEFIADKIFNADRLIFILDSEKKGFENYVNDLYLNILREIKHKQYYVIVTKADTFFKDKEWWQEDYNNLRNITINNLIGDGPTSVKVLIKRAKYIVPTFFRVKDKKPFSQNNKFTTVGFERVLEVVGK